METVEDIRWERGYARVSLTINERKFLRQLLTEAKLRGDDEATDRLFRVLDTAFEEHIRGTLTSKPTTEEQHR